MKFQATVTFDLDQLEEEIVSNFTHQTISRFIKDLDNRICDYDFTRGLRDYFTESIEEEDKFEENN